MANYYLRKPIRIGGKNTYIYCHHKWRNRPNRPPLNDEYVEKFFKEWGDGRYAFIKYKKGEGTKVAFKFTVSGKGWRGRVKGRGDKKLRYKKYRNGHYVQAFNMRSYEKGIGDALDGVQENEEETYFAGYRQGMKDHGNKKHRKIHNENMEMERDGEENEGEEKSDWDDQFSDDEYEPEFCPKCDWELDYNDENDTYICVKCKWREK